MDRNLALEFVRVTEAAALASARWVGRGEEKNGGCRGRGCDEKSFRYHSHGRHRCDRRRRAR